MSDEIEDFARKVDALYNGSNAAEVERLTSELVSQFLEKAKDKVDRRADELQETDCDCGYKKLWAAASDIEKMRESLP